MIQTHTLDEFRVKYRVDELTIFDTGIWTWSLRPEQPTLGSGIISLNRYALNFSDVDPDEMADLGKLIKIAEKTLKITFNHDVMNYLMLMMVDHHVHYHVIPRYEAARYFEGVSWADAGWPTLPILSDSQHKTRKGMLEAMCVLLKESI
ncbi:HIT family protein [Vibrio chagasii]|nr:HIT family protein [Vibrio chagasii]CAH7427160.1 HIT family protein [Vibrio chagasii]